MDISDDKMNVYKDLARKCESFELFKWIVGDKESWMTEAGKAETETMLKNLQRSTYYRQAETVRGYGRNTCRV